MKTAKVGLTYALIFLLVSCNTSRDKTPSALDQLCGKSCWNNIVVGQTTRDELLRIINNLHSVDQASITDTTVSDKLVDERIFFSLYNDPNSRTALKVSIYLSHQKVVAFDLNGILGVKLRDVIKEFGEPNLVLAMKNQAGNVDVSFLDPLEGILFNCIAKNEKSPITEDIEILTIEFFDPGQYQELLQSNWLLPVNDEKNLYPWSGYGSIVDHYWPPHMQ